MTEAERQAGYQREYRKRLARGETPLRMVASSKVIRAMIVTKKLTPAETRDKAHLALEVSAIVEAWAERVMKNTVSD